MSDAVIVLRLALVRLGFLAGSLLPLRPRVVLATSHASDIGGNLEALRRALAASHPEVPISVLAHRPADGLGDRLTAAIQAVRAGFELARARVFVVDDYYFPIYAIRPRRGTTIIQAWHASGAFKRMGYSLAGRSFGADAALLRRVRIHANYHICLISSAAALPHYMDAFRLPADRFTSRLGIPRTDLFFAPDAERRAAAIRQRYAIPAGRRVLLYAPTFRGDRISDARGGDELDLRLLRDALGSSHVLLLRLHPFVRARAGSDARFAGFVIDVSDHPDINELMLVSDVLVTDYSSAIYEFSLLGRPIVFFAPDREAYERERGFYFDYETGVPGPVFMSTAPLVNHLRAGSFDTARVDRFREASFDVADGHSSQRLVDEVVMPALAPPG